MEISGGVVISGGVALNPPSGGGEEEGGGGGGVTDSNFSNVELLLSGDSNGSTPDSTFGNVSLLISGDGSNGSTSFGDLSNKSHSITAAGDTQVSTSIKKYGTGSIKFDGTNDYLEIPSSSAFDLGTNDWTIEGWIYPETDSDDRGAVFELYNDDNNVLRIMINTGDEIEFRVESSGTRVVDIRSTNWNYDEWMHVAVVNNSGTITLYLNGTSEGTDSSFTIPDFSSARVLLGMDLLATDRWYTGYIDDFRVTKGVARYTSNFTAPTEAHPTYGSSSDSNFSNVSLLINGDGSNGSTSFSDSSSKSNSITAAGDTQVSTSVKKFGTGSIYFDGSGDYLSTSDSTNIGTGEYTIEMWIYPTTTGSGTLIDTRGSNPGTDGVGLFQANDRLQVYTNGYLINETSALTLNQWQHVALVRNSGTLTAYVDGSFVASVSNSDNHTNNSINIGANVGNSFNYTGYIDEIRITKGVARYTGNFTAPAAAFPPSGFSFPDLSSNSRIISVDGNTQVNTSTKKFGTGAIEFDGNGDRLTAPASADFAFDGDFTIEFWLNVSSNSPQYQTVLSNDYSSGYLIQPKVTGTDVEMIFYGDGTLTGSDIKGTVGSWHHWAIVRSSGVIKMYKDGVASSSTVSTTTTRGSSSQVLEIGSRTGQSWDLDGYVDELRITKGVARYTSNFTAPTAAFPTS